MSCGKDHDHEEDLPQEALDADPNGEPEQSQNGQDTDQEQIPEAIEGGGIDG